jgi:hypothetical protein
MHPRYHARPQFAIRTLTTHGTVSEFAGPAVHSTRRVGRCTHRDTAAPMPYKEDRPPRTSYMPHNSTHPAPTRVIPRHCSAAALQLRPQGPYTRRHDDATSSTRLMFRQTWLRPQGPYTRRHEDATTSDPVEVSSDSVEVSSDWVEVSSDSVEVSSDWVEVSSDSVEVR